MHDTWNSELIHYLSLLCSDILPGMIEVPPLCTSSERMPPSASCEVAGDRQEPAIIERPTLEEAEETCGGEPGLCLL